MKFCFEFAIHGAASHPLKEIKTEYSKYGNLYALHLPGHLGLDMQNLDSIPKLIDYYEAFIVNMNLTDIYIIGRSFGGIIACELMKRSSINSRVIKCILIATPLFGLNILLRVIRFCLIIIDRIYGRFPTALISLGMRIFSKSFKKILKLIKKYYLLY